MAELPEDEVAMLEVVKQIQQQTIESLPEPGRSDINAVVEFRSTLSSETDRGCSLMAAAYLDEQLEQLIRMKLVDDKKVVDAMFEGQGALATFSSRIDFAYLPGLIPKNAKRDLHLVRKIRNDFAHVSKNLTFETQNISSRCQELYFDGALRPVSSRSKFTRAMMGILGIIKVKSHTIIHETCPPDHDIELNRTGIRALYEALKEKGYEDNPFTMHFSDNKEHS